MEKRNAECHDKRQGGRCKFQETDRERSCVCLWETLKGMWYVHM